MAVSSISDRQAAPTGDQPAVMTEERLKLFARVIDYNDTGDVDDTENIVIGKLLALGFQIDIDYSVLTAAAQECMRRRCCGGCCSLATAGLADCRCRLRCSSVYNPASLAAHATVVAFTTGSGTLGRHWSSLLAYSISKK